MCYWNLAMHLPTVGTFDIVRQAEVRGWLQLPVIDLQAAGCVTTRENCFFSCVSRYHRSSFRQSLDLLLIPSRPVSRVLPQQKEKNI